MQFDHFWHGLLPNMPISRDSGGKFVIFKFKKSYCPLNFGNIYQISWFCCIPNRSYKEDSLKVGRICLPPCGIG